MTVQLDPIWTLVAALLAIQLGKRINAKIVWLERGNIPPAVTAGLFVSLVLPILRGTGWVDVRFQIGPRDHAAHRRSRTSGHDRDHRRAPRDTLFGRGREGAAATGGFIGFSLGAMPVGLAVMRRLNARFGDTPRALLAITLAASLFTDTANALIITIFFR